MQIQDNEVLAQIRHLERSFEGFPSGLMLLDLEQGKRLYGNSLLEELFGYSFEEWSADPSFHLRIIYPNDVAVDQAIREKARMAKPDEVSAYYCRAYHQDQRLLLYRVFNIPLTFTKKGKVKLSLSMGKVITELDPKEQEALSIDEVPLSAFAKHEDQVTKDNFAMFVKILKMRLNLLEQSSEDFF